MVRLSPVSMTMRMPSSRSASSAPASPALIGSAMAMTPAGCRRPRRKMTVAPSLAQSLRLAARVAAARPRCPREVLCCRCATRRPSTVPVTPLPVTEVEVRRAPQERVPRSLAAATIAAASGCSLAALEAGREPQQLGFADEPRPAMIATTSACPRSACRSCRPPACRPSPCAPALRRS